MARASACGRGRHTAPARLAADGDGLASIIRNAAAGWLLEHGGPGAPYLLGGMGAVLWSLDSGQSIGGGIVSYAVGGRQRVAVAMGMKSPIWPGAAEQSRIQVFGLP